MSLDQHDRVLGVLVRTRSAIQSLGMAPSDLSPREKIAWYRAIEEAYWTVANIERDFRPMGWTPPRPRNAFPSSVVIARLAGQAHDCQHQSGDEHDPADHD